MAGGILRDRGKHKIQGYYELGLTSFHIAFPLKFRHRKKPQRNE